jgi:hypothetical protein
VIENLKNYAEKGKILPIKKSENFLFKAVFGQIVAETVGFEPTCPCGQPLFESGALQPTSLRLRTRLTIICYEARQRQTKSD